MWGRGEGRGEGRRGVAAAAPITLNLLFDSVVQWLDGIGDDERECVFMVLLAAYPDGVVL